jgi:hypothetical protein
MPWCKVFCRISGSGGSLVVHDSPEGLGVKAIHTSEIVAREDAEHKATDAITDVPLGGGVNGTKTCICKWRICHLIVDFLWTLPFFVTTSPFHCLLIHSDWHI